MPTPLPDAGSANLSPPDAAEVAIFSRGVVSVVTTPTGLSDTQRLLTSAVFVAMTGHPATIEFRTRIVQIMILLGLVLRPLPDEIAGRIAEFAEELGVEDGMLEVARRFAEGSLGLAAMDFERNGYTATWTAEDAKALHTSNALPTANRMPARLAGRSRGCAGAGPTTTGLYRRSARDCE